MKFTASYLVYILCFVKYEADAGKVLSPQSTMMFQTENNTERIQFSCGFKMPSTNYRASHRYVRRWRNNIVPYLYQSSISSTDKQVFQIAMKQIESRTCIRFRPRSSQRNYLSISWENNFRRCNPMALSFGGYTDGLGAASPRSLTIVGGSEMGCLRRTKAVVGLLIHEIGHALGLIHEHKRPDRDQYIKINQANISPGNLAQFDICRDCLTYGIPYNCRSIMHYSAFTMSKNQRPTMTAFNPHTCDIISTHDEFTKEDADGLNIIYKCKGKG